MDRKSSKYLRKDTNKSSDAPVTSQLWNFPSFSLREMIKDQEREKERQLWIGSIEVSQSGKEIQELVKHKPYSLREIIKDREGEHANSNKTTQIVEKSYRDVIVSGTSNERSKAGRNIIEKTIEEERQSDAQRSQEHETKSVSSVIRSRIHEISMNKINEENVQNYLNKVYDISNEIANIDPKAVNSIEQKEKHTRFLRESHMQLKTLMIESHDLYQRYEQSKQNKTQIKNEEEFDRFVKKLVETEKNILYKYDLDYSPEEKSEYNKAVLALGGRNTWYNTYPEFKCAIEQSTPETKQEKLENLISNYKSTINQIRKYQKLDRSSPKEAALQRLEYSYLKGKLKALNLIWKDVLQIKGIKGDIPQEFLSEYKRLEKGAPKFRNAVLKR